MITLFELCEIENTFRVSEVGVGTNKTIINEKSNTKIGLEDFKNKVEEYCKTTPVGERQYLGIGNLVVDRKLETIAKYIECHLTIESLNPLKKEVKYIKEIDEDSNTVVSFLLDDESVYVFDFDNKEIYIGEKYMHDSFIYDFINKMTRLSQYIDEEVNIFRI